MTMDAQVLLAVAGTSIALVGIVGRVVWGVGREIRELRETVSALRVLLESQRLDEREWVLQQIRRHAAECPGREPTGVRAMPVE